MRTTLLPRVRPDAPLKAGDREVGVRALPGPLSLITMPVTAVPWWKSDNAKVIASACAAMMLVAVVCSRMWVRLVPWAKEQDGTAFGFVCTALGFVVGFIALVLTILIFRWTGREDDARHRELREDNAGLREDNRHLRAEAEKQTAQGAELKQDVADLKRLLTDLAPRDQDADLSELKDDQGAALRQALNTGERVFMLRRFGAGKGNHAWFATTSERRVLRISAGGRTGGVHVNEV